MTNHNTSLFSSLLLLSLLALVSLASAHGTVSTYDLQKIKEEESYYRRKKVIDISHKYVPDLPSYASKKGLGDFLNLVGSIKNGSLVNLSTFKLSTHSGTHADAPGHFIDKLFDMGCDADSLDLRTLNGPVLVVDTPRDKNITAEVMRSLNIPRGVKRVLFRTSNTDKRLMHQKEFEPSYTAFTADGAEYLVQNTDIKLVGIDYLSVGINVRDDISKVHYALLGRKDIIPVEGLNLDNVVPGVYTVHCLPLRLVHGDGSPASGFSSTLEGYCDANWISNSDETKFTSSYVFTLGGGAVSWRSAMQTIIARSTMKSEFLALELTVSSNFNANAIPGSEELRGSGSGPRHAMVVALKLTEDEK
ncbi:hypothetical protein BC332_11561 [Capsicum chinense]|nr:hypothetical protein BC332_11561 [Capsicum chinense]